MSVFGGLRGLMSKNYNTFDFFFENLAGAQRRQKDPQEGKKEVSVIRSDDPRQYDPFLRWGALNRSK